MTRVGVSLPVREMAADLIAIRDFAQAAEALGLTHLRVPDQVIRPNSGHLYEPMTLLSYIAGITSTIELVPSVIVLPMRPTALVAKEVATLDQLCGGRLRVGIGVGANPAEYQALGVDFSTRGRRCDEQLNVLRALWTQQEVSFSGEFHAFENNGINPLPLQDPLPIWVGARSIPGDAVVERIGRHAQGWFVLASPEAYPDVKSRIDEAARRAGRDPEEIGTEAGVAVVGPRQAEWQARVGHWAGAGLTHICLRTLGGELAVDEHIPTLENAARELPEILGSQS